LDARLPDFFVVGAMKCATTTLHAQISAQPGVFMPPEKEPNFFSDDAIHARGVDWYASLFEDAPPGVVVGESSTSYTKLPTYPQTVVRLARTVPGARFIYVIRHPIDRLVSHFLHDRGSGRIDHRVTLEEAVARHPELIDYGLYAMQLRPYRDAFGPGRVLPVFFTRLAERPDEVLARIGRFLGVDGSWRWDDGLGRLNASDGRLRYSPIRHALATAPVLTPLRRRLLPQATSDRLKRLWLDRTERPEPRPELVARLVERFDPDLARLGEWLGVELSCASFRRATRDRDLEWAG
jgi:hypothetical protein